MVVSADQLFDLTARQVEAGFLAFPVRPNDKRPLIDNGFKGANADLAGISTWIHAAGRPNVGLVRPLSEDPPVFLWDVDGGDGKTSWRDDFAALEARLGPLPRTWVQKTPSGGRHINFRWRTDRYGPPPKGNKLLGFTVRWPGKGYILGPGSSIDDVIYEWNGALIVDFPETWARAALAEAAGPLLTVTAGGEVTLPDAVREGDRYDAIRTLVAQLYNRRVPKELIWSAVVHDLAPRFSVPLHEAELLERFTRTWVGIEARLGPPAAATREERVEAAARATSWDDLVLDELSVGTFPADPDPIAFDGVAGQAVEWLELQTSASRVGLLAGILSISGIALAVTTHFYARQPSAFMSCLVGESGIGRKTTAMMTAWDALTAESAFGPLRGVLANGIGSGEGVVISTARRAEHAGYARTEIFEPEFGSILTVSKREGSSLSYVVRTAFDHLPLNNITARGQIGVEPEHYQLGILAGITPDELRSLIAQADLLSGFANRFLWVPVVGRDTSGDGSGNAPRLAAPLTGQFKAALEQADRHRHQPVRLADDARGALKEYADHLATVPGLGGTLATRLSTIATRLALIHSQLDRPGWPAIEVEMVDRAIALTEYCRSGLAWVFGAAADVGSPDAARVLRALLTWGEPMTKSQLGNLVWRKHYSAERIDRTIEDLLKVRLIELLRGPSGPAGGRPVTLIRALGAGSPSSDSRFLRSGLRARPRAREETEQPVLTNGAEHEHVTERNNLGYNPLLTNGPSTGERGPLPS